MNNLDHNSSNQNHNVVVLEQLMAAEKLGEVQAPLKPSLMILPEAKPLYRPIILGVMLFMLALHSVGFMMVPNYSSFGKIHLMSLVVAVLAILILGVMSYQTAKVKNV